MAHGMFETIESERRMSGTKVPRSSKAAKGNKHVLSDALDAAALMARIIINVVFWQALPREIRK